MSDPTRAPAGWYEDESGGRWYWDGDAWAQYAAPGFEGAGAPPSQVAPAPGDTEVLPAAAADSPTIPFVWGSRGSDAATTVPYAAVNVGANADATTESFGEGSTMVLPGHPFTEPSNPGPNVVGIIGLVAAIVGLVFVFIPAMSGVAWVLVPAGFVLSIVGLFLRGAKWAAVTGLVVSIIAAIVGIVMLITMVIGSLGNFIEGIEDSFPEVPVFPQPEQPQAPEAPVAGHLRFGETMTWDDGVALTVSVPEPYTPSDFAVGATHDTAVVFTLTITNNSTEDLQPLPLPTLSSGDQEVSQIFDIGSNVIDPGDDVGFPPTATIEPGGSVSWRAAWSLDDPSSLTLEAAPSFLYPSATFTNVP